MRYNGTIFVDIWGKDKQDAEKQFEKIVLGLNNAYAGDLVRKQDGSEISLVQENDPTDQSLISKSHGDGR